MTPIIPNPFADFRSPKPLKNRSALEWEEGLHGSDTNVHNPDGDGDIPSSPLRTGWLRFVLVGAVGVLVVQLFNLQVVQGSKMRELSEGNRLRLQTILAPRGFIEDRYGEVIAKNTASFNLAVTPADVPKDTKVQIFQKFSQEFGVSIQEIEDTIQHSTVGVLEPIIVKRNISQQESIKFSVLAQQLPGFSLMNIPVRDYVNSEVFSHALGYTGVISDEEYKNLSDEHYYLNDFIGKSGIEQSYEKYLRGTNGNKQLEVDSMGKPIKELGTAEPKPGNIVQLNIDAGLQKVLYDQFASSSTNKGAAVAINPKTGEILALVSVPGFNNNLFAPGISQSDYQKLLQDERLPLYNRAISGLYPPGSTIKPVTAAAVLQEGIVKPNTIIYDNGVLVIPNQFNAGISYNFYGWKRDGLGAMDVRSAIAQSSDIYFYTVSGGHPNSPIKGIGAEKLADYYRKFGMGAVTGIDVPGEKGGRVADPAWKEAYYKNDKTLGKWYLGDTYHISIGQGDMIVSPLQVAVWTAAIANNGVLNKPHLLKQVLDQSGKTIFTPQVEALINSGIDLEYLKVVQEGMRDNVISEKGSGRQLASLPISAAGKTGTSQFDGSDPSRTHAWYAAYAPYEDPQIAIVVLVEAGGEGHAASVPIVKNALKWWAENRYQK